ncbi:MAG TPA: sulfurtransferase-like selenium metabolism protein YedF [Bacillota bacterium]|jgi:selenium metabolism protein YedF|nr:sulfurtransferase-like selenium metabolism protein YedF [Peptococcaceae bacterium MAG4]NLW39249.1 sulfurtransferase-like selenium metabolism protein YedF [Peptococcaceae bacterium]HPU35424.1 sulfurtransferase-like selenium metabolism protein YedF [Bacillota bacterium]HPZ42852.1 sulfurtransferase-like selenium metabolism protein YedF [Bacillota bacterium]HQD75607.1 sulfurtransferase-like selenium metabolism protein YedF [Bacillota bacterium]
MSKKVLDCRGMACPQPVLETKKALEEGFQQEMLIIVDNDAARENVSRFARNAGYSVEVEEKEGCYHLTVNRGPGETQPTAAETANESCDCEAPGGIVYFITTNTLGQGSPDLGEVLMKSLMVTLAEQKPPRALCLLNTGVFLALEDSPVIEQMKKLSASTEILVCGTCLNYYKVKEKMAVGVVSNMYDINSRLTGASKVITVG